MSSNQKLNQWKKGLIRLTKKHNIRLSKTITDDKSAKRIAVLVSELFIEVFKEVKHSGYIEADLFLTAKRMKLKCDEIDEEMRIQEIGRKVKGFDPLKIHNLTKEHNEKLMNEIFDIILNNLKGARINARKCARSLGKIRQLTCRKIAFTRTPVKR